MNHSDALPLGIIIMVTNCMHGLVSYNEHRTAEMDWPLVLSARGLLIYDSHADEAG